MLKATVLKERERAAFYVLQSDVVLRLVSPPAVGSFISTMEAKTKEDDDYIYLLEPFGGQVFVSGPNNTKHVTFKELTIHKQRKGRLPSVFTLLVPPATRYMSEVKFTLWDSVIWISIL
jgi:hypothetical protein